MKYNSSYLVCQEYLQEVKDFLSQFFLIKKDNFSHDLWITFVVPDADFKINLMKGEDQDITQNMTFEITCDSLTQLKELAHKYDLEVASFTATKSSYPYTYHYIEIIGPNNICKVEANFLEM